MKLRDLQNRIWEKSRADGVVGDDGVTNTKGWRDNVSLFVDHVVLATIEGLGFHISDAGEICDPRPAPPSYSEQTGPAYSKFSRGRRRR